MINRACRAGTASNNAWLERLARKLSVARCSHAPWCPASSSQFALRADQSAGGRLELFGTFFHCARLSAITFIAVMAAWFKLA